MNILTIDWDYFFMDSEPYDWGHKENGFFLEAIWPIRLNNHNIFSGAEAFSEFKPTIPKDFWKRVVKNSTMIFVAESHATIAGMPFRNATVTNLDAHHDCGYSNFTDLECGNWAWHERDRIKHYHLYYPEWRKNESEGTPLRQPDSISYGLPELADYDIIFVCRSGCWTPPWYDKKFRTWLKQSGLSIHYVDEFVKKDRAPSMKEAKLLKVSLEENFRQLRERKP